MGRFFMAKTFENQRIRRVALADIVAMHNKEPMKFQLPEARHLNSVSVGDHVKVGVLNKEDLTKIAEHFWVRVTEISEDGQYTGYIDNEPEILLNLKIRDKLVFSRNNIMAALVYNKASTRAK